MSFRSVEVKCTAISGHCSCLCAAVFERSALTSIKDEQKSNVIRKRLQSGQCEHVGNTVDSVNWPADEIFLPNFTPYLTSHPSMSALHLAVLCEDIAIVRWLLQNKHVTVDVTTGFFGDSPLHLAVLRQNLDMVKLLVCYKYDVNLSSPQAEQTAIFLTTIRGDSQILEFLIRCGANVDKTPHNKLSPLHQAVRREHSRCVELLIEAGATQTSESTGPDRFNLLMLAMPDVSMLKVLLKGHDPQINEELHHQVYSFRETPLLHTLRFSQYPQFCK